MTETNKTQKIQVVEMSKILLVDLYYCGIKGLGCTLVPYQKKALNYERGRNHTKIEVPAWIIEGIVEASYYYGGCSIATREMLCDLIETAHDASDEFVELGTVMEILAGSDIPEETEDEEQEEPFTQESEIRLCLTVNQLNTLYASIRADEKTIKHEQRGLLSVYPDMEFYSDTELMTSLAKVVKDTQARL